MAFQKGQVANPKGRPKGSRNKRAVMLEAIQKQAIDDGISPLDLMLDLMRNDAMPLGVRFECAKAAAPYVHRKMPQAVEISQEQFKVFDPAQLQGLSIEEMQQMARLLRKAHAAEMEALNGGVTIDGTAQRVADVVRTIGELPALPKPKPKPAPRPKSQESKPWE